MKEFNLEEYLKNPDREIVTRDGRKVRILCTDRKGDTPIIALVHDANDGQEYGYAFYSDGKFFRDGNKESDLFFAPEKHEGWTNVYEEGTNRYLDGCICSTEEEAKRIRGCGYITTIKIEWEE